MIVVAMIGILAAIAAQQFNRYRMKGYIATLNSDVKNAYTASMVYTSENPNAVAADMTQLNFEASGYVASNAITIATNNFVDVNSYEVQATMAPNQGLSKPTAELDTAGLYVPATM